jgi:putative NADPH-quinone reductase
MQLRDGAHDLVATVVIAQPRPGSFDHAIAGKHVVQVLSRFGYEVRLHDLYAEGFDPLIGAAEIDTTIRSPGPDNPLLAAHQRDLSASDTLVVVHPNWWGKPPAMMAGWIDRVLAPGVVYRLSRGEKEPELLLRLREVIVVNTSDTPAERERDRFGDPLQAIWGRCVNEYLGAERFTRLVFGPVSASDDAQRRGWLGQLDILASTGRPYRASDQGDQRQEPS